jgi:hypothetical protein
MLALRPRREQSREQYGLPWSHFRQTATAVSHQLQSKNRQSVACRSTVGDAFSGSPLVKVSVPGGSECFLRASTPFLPRRGPTWPPSGPYGLDQVAFCRRGMDVLKPSPSPSRLGSPGGTLATPAPARAYSLNSYPPVLSSWLHGSAKRSWGIPLRDRRGSRSRAP